MARKLQPLIEYLLSRKTEIIYNVNDSIAGFIRHNILLFDEFSPELRPGTRYSVAREVLCTLRQEDNRLACNNIKTRAKPKQTGREYQFSIIYTENNGKHELHIQPIDEHHLSNFVVRITNMNFQALKLLFEHDFDKKSGQVQFKNT
jgi:hypothetical protein